MKKCSMGNCPGIVVDSSDTSGDGSSNNSNVVVVGYPVKIEDQVIHGFVGLPIDYWRQFTEENPGSADLGQQSPSLADRIISTASGDPSHDDFLVFGGTVIEHPQAGEGEVAIRLVTIREN